MYRIVFELIRKNVSSERKINDDCDGGNYDMRANYEHYECSK